MNNWVEERMTEKEMKEMEDKMQCKKCRISMKFLDQETLFCKKCKNTKKYESEEA